jgi:hypothetical protein
MRAGAPQGHGSGSVFGGSRGRRSVCPRQPPESVLASACEHAAGSCDAHCACHLVFAPFCAYVCMCVWHACIQTCTLTYGGTLTAPAYSILTRVHMHLFMYLCMHLCMYVCTHIYKQTLEKWITTGQTTFSISRT